MRKDEIMPSVAEPRADGAEVERGEPARAGAGRPRLPTAAADTHAGREALRAARAFCATGGDAGGMLEPPGDDVLPALLHAMRDPGRVRTGEPLVLLHREGPGVQGFADWLSGAIDAEFGAEEARELRDNARRIERAAREAARGGAAPLGGLLSRAVETVVGEIGLQGEPAARMTRDAGKIADALDEQDRAIALDDAAVLRVMLHLAQRRYTVARGALRERVKGLRDRLERKIVGEAARGAKRASETLGLGAPGAFDPAALGKVLGERRGPKPMEAERRRRLTGLLERLDGFLAERVPPAHVVVRESGGGGEIEGVDVVEAELPCAEAVTRWDRIADRHLPLFLAVRVAALEAEDAYDEGVHGPSIESFTRRMLSDEEIAALPSVIAVESLARLAGEDMANATGALLSGRAIRVLLDVDPGAAASEAGLARFEPGLFGMGLRVAVVHQSAVSSPEHLARGFERAVASGGPSLHVIATGKAGDGGPAVGRWLHAGAATESRAHPLFIYDPSPGPSWADRFDFAGNEQAEGDWPEHSLDCIDAGGAEMPLPLSFTFADFALLEPGWRDAFRVVPEECAATDLAPVGEVIGAARQADRRIPFVWGVGAGGKMRRLAVSRRLVDASRDRLSCWRTLQEFAGVHDVYAERAAAGERERAAAESGEAIAKLRVEHAAELERVRREEASAALGRLAESIMGVDPATLMSAPAAPKARAAKPSVAPAESAAEAGAPAAPEPAGAEEDEDLGFDEPYIDSALCTSCNDCTNLNPQMFKYNANKQAEIADPDAGPFRDLVVAAEKCPARCIHPGKPRNPDEPGLVELVERAKKFN